MTEINTERLTLRPLGTEYLESVHEYASDPENTKYMIHLPNESIEETRDFLLRAENEWMKEAPSFYEFAVIYKGRQIGAVSLSLEGRASGELGWILNKKYWGQKIAGEAASALMEYAVKELGIRHFTAHCDAENTASYRTMEKLGMTQTSIEGGRRNRASDEDRMECLYELYVDLPEKERHGMKIEMHVHTSEGSPCAETDAESIVRAYSEAGYDAVVITNHFDSVLLKDFGVTDDERIERYLLGYRKAKAVEEKYGIKVMLGVEIRLEPDDEDFLIYGIDEEFLFRHPDLCFMDQQTVYELCHSCGAVFYQAHPFREPCVPRDPEFLDGVEFNQRPRSGNHNDRLSRWVKAHPDLKFISGSDCHNLEQVGYGGIEVPRPVCNARELAELLKETQVKLILCEHTSL